MDIPFLDGMISFFENRTNLKLGITGTSAGKAFWVTLLSVVVYLIIFPAVSKVINLILSVGSEEKSGLKAGVTRVMMKIAGLFFSALLTGLVRLFLLEWLYENIHVNRIIMTIMSVGIAGAALAVLFFVVGVPIVVYVLWVLGKIVFASTVKLLATEFFLIFMYYIMNIPGVFEQTGTLILMIVGILACIGAVTGTEIFENKMDSYVDDHRGKHAYRLYS